MISISYPPVLVLPATDEEPTWYHFPAPGEARETPGGDSREEPPALPFQPPSTHPENP